MAGAAKRAFRKATKKLRKRGLVEPRVHRILQAQERKLNTKGIGVKAGEAKLGETKLNIFRAREQIKRRKKKQGR